MVAGACTSTTDRTDPDPDVVRLAVAVGDSLHEAPTGARYRILARVGRDALVDLVGAIQAEFGPAWACVWCNANHALASCPELPLDLALAVYAS